MSTSKAPGKRAGVEVHPPAEDEIEISVLGPGYGENIIVHVGLNDWLIVDSCISPTSKRPATLEYLEKIKVPCDNVRLVVATHWHDDHVRGIAEVYQSSPNATLVCSDALKSDEFVRLLGVSRQTQTKGVQEFGRILDIVSRRDSPPLKWAIADLPLWHRDSDLRLPFSVDVVSLSPAHAEVTSSRQRLRELLPGTGDIPAAVIAPTRNDCAVAMLVRIGENRILLGSDLQETAEHATGWTVIVDSTTRPRGKSTVFKIPHHGSENGDQPLVWSEMLEPNPLAVITPFHRGSVKLPKPADLTRIAKRTDAVYQTAKLIETHKNRRSMTVERGIREAVRSIRELGGSVGHVRLRKKIGAEKWVVDLFGDAHQIRGAN